MRIEFARFNSGHPSRATGVACTVGVFCSVFLLYAVLSLSRWNAGLSTNYDLGIFSQGAADWARGDYPKSEIRDLPLLGDHFSPLLSLTGIAWNIWPDPRSLLLFQAAGIALSSAHLYHFFHAKKKWVALIATLTLVFGRGALSGGLFDFHETVALSPALAYACSGVLSRKRRRVICACLLLLLVKEDAAALVLGLAGAWALSAYCDRRRAVRYGTPALLAAIAVAGLVVAILTIAHFSPTSGSSYLGFFGFGHPPEGQPHTGGWSVHRLGPALGFGLSCLFVGLRSPLALAALPTIVWRTVSSNPLHWSWDYHYDFQPALIGAFCLGSVLETKKISRKSMTIGASAVLLNAILAASLISFRLNDGIVLNESQRVTNINQLAALLPQKAKVSTLNNTGVYLLRRNVDVYDMRHPMDSSRFLLFTDSPEWLGELPRCARDELIGIGHDRHWKITVRGDVILIDKGSIGPTPLPHCP